MIPATQTKVVVKDGAGKVVIHGNCWAAAIASILGLPLSEVPNFEVWYEWNDGLWWYLTLRFLIKKGFLIEQADQYRVFHLKQEEWADTEYVEDYNILKESLKGKYYLLSGNSPRGFKHVTIWKEGIMVHDPHPTRDGITTLDTFEHIRPLTEEEKGFVDDYSNYYNVAFPCHYQVNKETVS